MNCRAPYEQDEGYTAMRPPNTLAHSAADMAAAAAAVSGVGNFAFNMQAQIMPSEDNFMPLNSFVGGAGAVGGGVGVGIGGGMVGGAVSPTSKLSVNASEFVPHHVGATSSGVQQRLQQYAPQQNYYGQQQQQAQQRQNYCNGYQQDPTAYNAQQQYQLNNTVQSVTTSLQDRLRINSGGKHNPIGGMAIAAGGNVTINSFYQQQQQQQLVAQPPQQHTTKQFHKHPHLNQYHQQQQQQHHHQQQVQQHQQHRQPNHHLNHYQSNHQTHAGNQHQHHQHQAAAHHHQHHHQQPQQHQHTHSSSSSTSLHSSHQQQQQQHQYFPSSSNSSSSANDTSSSSHPDMEIIALEYLDTVIHCLNQNPGQFDTIASRFLTIFDGMETNNYVLPIAMEDIFEKSIENPNFRYMGAKLYNLLHMMNPKKDSLFHTLLKCKLDYHQNDVKSFMESNQQHKVRETALFLAELYMQLRGDDSRIHLIAENIVYSLKKLLEKETSDNVRCICLTLKLAGYDLTADCPEDMKEIISKLDAINVNSPGKYPLAANVISLQKNNWGRKVSNSLGDGDSTKPPEPPRLSDDPVFYGPDGRELTAEESDFLAGDAAAGPGSDDDDDDDGDLDCDFDLEMDEETERAYNDFCKQQQKDAAAAAASAKYQHKKS